MRHMWASKVSRPLPIFSDAQPWQAPQAHFVEAVQQLRPLSIPREEVLILAALVPNPSSPNPLVLQSLTILRLMFSSNTSFRNSMNLQAL